MFENPGAKIKKFAKIVFWLSVIGSVILAFVFGWTEKYSYYSGYYNVFQAEYFFTFLIAGPLASYISSLFIVAFGDLVENTQHIKAATEEIKKNNEK